MRNPLSHVEKGTRTWGKAPGYAEEIQSKTSKTYSGKEARIKMEQQRL